jgi:hypothetical protein
VARETAYGSIERKKPLKGEPWTRLRGEINLQGRSQMKPSRAGGTPRTDRSVEMGSLRGRWLRLVDVVKRDGTPREALLGFRLVARSGGVARGRLQAVAL